MKKTAISVVMPVFNTPRPYLEEAVESILQQSFADFEFIIIDDYSDDSETLGYLDSISDQRVCIIRNDRNKGITKSLNIGVRAASGKYIARMDSDDIALPQRLEKQYAFMEEKQDAILCGTRVEFFGERTGIWESSIKDQELYRIRLLFGNAGPCHPSVMFRRDKMIEYNLLYDENLRYTQDYMMWVIASKAGPVYCMEEVLLKYRIHKGQVSAQIINEKRRCSIFVRKRLLEQLFDDVSMEMVEKHMLFCFEKNISNESCRWFKTLIRSNREKEVYDRKKFETAVYDYIAEKICGTYDIHWNEPKSYRIFLNYLPASYVLIAAKRKTADRLRRAIHN